MSDPIICKWELYKWLNNLAQPFKGRGDLTFTFFRNKGYKILNGSYYPMNIVVELNLYQYEERHYIGSIEFISNENWARDFPLELNHEYNAKEFEP